MKKINLPKIIPVFPLSNFIIFPNTTVPLNIFEPRYIGMINDSLKTNKIIGLIQPKKNMLNSIPELHILASDIDDRLGVLSFYIENVHYNLIVKLLNDRYGIQVRGGCSCAGTYGHYLLHVDPTRSNRITEKISKGDLSENAES